MNKRFTLIIATAVGLLLIAIILISVLSPDNETPVIALPNPSTDIGGDDSGLVTVNPETVQTAVSTLARLESYSGEYTVSTFWSGGSSSSTVKIWRNGDKQKIVLQQGRANKNILVLAGSIFIWYDDAPAEVFTAEVSSFDQRRLDRSARILNYEGILSAEIGNILDAGYTKHSGENCIFAEYLSDDETYVNRIYISVSTGLLVAAEVTEGGDTIYTMETLSTSLTTPEDSVFTPPVT